MNKAPSEETPTGASTHRGSWLLALFLILVAIAAAWFAFDIPTTRFQSEGDPGPRALPWLLAVLLGCGGVWELVLAILSALSLKPPGGDATESDESILPAHFATMLGLVVAYLIGLSLVGFMISSAVLAVALIVWLQWRAGDSPKRIALIAGLGAVGLLSAVYGLFVMVFRVVLP